MATRSPPSLQTRSDTVRSINEPNEPVNEHVFGHIHCGECYQYINTKYKVLATFTWGLFY